METSITWLESMGRGPVRPIEWKPVSVVARIKRNLHVSLGSAANILKRELRHILPAPERSGHGGLDGGFLQTGRRVAFGELVPEVVLVPLGFA
ncbi:unnamed protein product, partial [Linum tenue]